MEELAAMLPHHVAEGAWSQLRTGFEANFPRRLGTRWREAVLADNRDRPPAIHPSGDKGEVLTRYGTTLLATLAVGDLLLLAQLGDGCVLLVRPDGVVERPLASDGHEVGTVTDSLCSPEAYRLWRTTARERGRGGLLLLATDGLTNAFVDEQQLRTFAGSLGERLRDFGAEKVAVHLPDWLDSYSSRASGDDVTLAVVILRASEVAPSEPPDIDAGVSQVDDCKEKEDVPEDRSAGASGHYQESADR